MNTPQILAQFAAESAGAPLSVLYIENDLVDEMALLKAVAGEQPPYRVTLARSVAEARAVLAAQRFDIVLADYELGDGNAFDLMAEFAGQVVIFITGSGDEEIAARALQLGVRDYLIKDPNRGYLKLLPLRIEAALREARALADVAISEARLRAIIDASPVAMALNDAGGRITFLNPAFVHTFGYTLEDIPTLAEWWPKAYPNPAYRQWVAETWQAELASAHTGNSFAPLERTILCKNGEERFAVIIATPLTETFAGTHLVVLQDITARKQAEREKAIIEDQLRQSQKLESLGTLAGGIAHDFNNILAGIAGYTSLARQTTDNAAKQVSYLAEIDRAGKRGAKLVQQILAFSRADNQTLIPLHLHHVVNEAVQLLRATLPQTIEFAVNLSTNLPPVLGNATQLHQVMMNLGTNAWHAMPAGGRLSVRLDACAVNAEFANGSPDLSPGQFVRLTISDTGCGMSDAIQGRVFEPFFTTKAPGEGAGLGLSVMHGIVRGHHGAIRLTSKVDQGATFEIYFPALLSASESTASAREDTQENLPRGNGERILFVDDDPSLVTLGDQMLHLLGYTVEAESEVKKALAHFEEDPDAFQLVITDQTMPIMSGLEFAARIHSLRAELPVILTSGYSMELTAEKIQGSGRTEVLAKPYSQEALAKIIARQLPRHSVKE